MIQVLSITAMMLGALIIGIVFLLLLIYIRHQLSKWLNRKNSEEDIGKS